jgi:hypothetical protein
MPHMRFLCYKQVGGILPPHIDLSRTDRNGNMSTHTFILYLTSCSTGGETSLLHKINCDSNCMPINIIAKVKPVRGRLLLFPHITPHEGNKVENVPKLLLRGEML